jgi:glyoxylase-like metal-dependent hydrolase (beta-lactamase superfamily II)
MKEVADGVWHLNTVYLPNAVNAYLIGDVLVDAGTRHSTKGILRDLEGHTVTAHALTHAHADHQGASHEVCEALGIPFWVPEKDADAAEDPSLIGPRQPSHPLAQFYVRIFAGPGHPVDRRLREGDEVAGFKVLETPGHSAGHVVFWRESDRVLVIGDVLVNMHQALGYPRFGLPMNALTPDPARNRESAKRLGPLAPELVVFGHGPPLRNPRKFADFCAGL